MSSDINNTPGLRASSAFAAIDGVWDDKDGDDDHQHEHDQKQDGSSELIGTIVQAITRFHTISV